MREDTFIISIISTYHVYQVQKFVDQREAGRQRSRAAAEERLRELQQQMAEQAVHDQQRVRFRCVGVCISVYSVFMLVFIVFTLCLF